MIFLQILRINSFGPRLSNIEGVTCSTGLIENTQVSYHHPISYLNLQNFFSVGSTYFPRLVLLDQMTLHWYCAPWRGPFSFRCQRCPRPGHRGTGNSYSTFFSQEILSVNWSTTACRKKKRPPHHTAWFGLRFQWWRREVGLDELPIQPDPNPNPTRAK